MRRTEFVEDPYHSASSDKKSRTHDNKPTKRRHRRKRLLFLVAVVLGIFVFFMSPFFSAKNIEVTEISPYTKQEICEKIGLNTNSNIIFFNKLGAEKILRKDPYIRDVDIKQIFPSTIRITLTERTVRGYVPYITGSYLYIDEYGMILDVKDSFQDPLPVVEGLSFSKFMLGEVLEVENKEALDVVVRISQLMIKYQILDIVMKIDVREPKNIRATANQVEIQLGDITNLDLKIRTMAAILEKIKIEDRGTLDLRDVSKPIIFKYLK